VGRVGAVGMETAWPVKDDDDDGESVGHKDV
jgi:hypothetical protein